MAEAAVALANEPAAAPAAPPAAPSPPPSADTPAPSTAAPSAPPPTPITSRPPIDWEKKYHGEIGKFRTENRELRTRVATAAEQQAAAAKLQEQLKAAEDRLANFNALQQVIRENKDLADLIAERIGALPDDGSRERAVLNLPPEIVADIKKAAQLADRAEASQRAAVERQQQIEQLEFEKGFEKQVGDFVKAKNFRSEFVAHAQAYVFNRIAKMEKANPEALKDMPDEEVDALVDGLLNEWAAPHLKAKEAWLEEIRTGKTEDAKLPPVAGVTGQIAPAPIKHAMDSNTKKLAIDMLMATGNWNNNGVI